MKYTAGELPGLVPADAEYELLQSISVAFEHCMLRVVVALQEFVVNSFTDCHGKGMSSSPLVP